MTKKTFESSDTLVESQMDAERLNLFEAFGGMFFCTLHSDIFIIIKIEKLTQEYK